MAVLALDIGATKFAAGVVDPHYGLHGVRRAAAASADPWATCRQLLVAVAGDNEVSAVGIGSAGPVDVPAGVIRPLNLAAWRDGFAIVEQVRALFPNAVVRLAIDGACLVLAEHRVGGLRGVDNGLALTVSSGSVGGSSPTGESWWGARAMPVTSGTSWCPATTPLVPVGESGAWRRWRAGCRRCGGRVRVAGWAAAASNSPRTRVVVSRSRMPPWLEREPPWGRRSRRRPRCWMWIGW